MRITGGLFIGLMLSLAGLTGCDRDDTRTPSAPPAPPSAPTPPPPAPQTPPKALQPAIGAISVIIRS